MTIIPFAMIVLSVRPISYFLTGMVAAFAFFFMVRYWGDRKWFSTSCLLAMITYAVVSIVPGFLTIPKLDTAPLVEFVEWHYCIVVSQGDRLASGLRFFEHIAPHYGFIGPFLLGLAQKAFGHFSFAAHVRIVQTMQVLFILAAFFGYAVWSRRNWPAIFIVFVSVVAATHTLHNAVFFPNQAGWRMLGLPVGILILLLSERHGARGAARLGAAAGSLILFNPETGFVITGGYIAFLAGSLIGSGDFRTSIRCFWKFLISAAFPMVVFATSLRVFFGHFPFSSADGLATTFARFSSGYGGLPITFRVIWATVFLHALVEVVLCAVRLRVGLGARAKVRGAIAVTIILWSGYFFNRPNPWNFWTFIFLYGFFIIDFTMPEAVTRYWGRIRQFRLPLEAAIATAFIIACIASILVGARDNVLALAKLKSIPTRGSALLSGMEVPQTYADIVSRKANYLRRHSNPGEPLTYFTASAFSMPLLSGVVAPLPMADPYIEAFTYADTAMLIKWIARTKPPELLFDDETVGWGGNIYRHRYIARLKAQFAADYRLDKTSEGWEIWNRISTTD